MDLCPICVQVHESEQAHEVSLSDVLLPDAPQSLFGEPPQRTVQAIPGDVERPIFMRPIDLTRRMREEFEVPVE